MRPCMTISTQRMAECNQHADHLRPLFYRPSLIWNWKKLDGTWLLTAWLHDTKFRPHLLSTPTTVLPVIPIFNLASAVGVPFVDKTVRVETLAAAIIAGLEDDSCSGVQRFPEMESLAARLA